MWCLAFKLGGWRRHDAGPGRVGMYRVPPPRASWPAVGAPLERGLGLHSSLLEGRSLALCDEYSADDSAEQRFV